MVDPKALQYALNAVGKNGLSGNLTIREYELIRAACAAYEAAKGDADRAEITQVEPVAWRWKPKQSSHWIYNPEVRWLLAQDLTTIDKEGLYLHPTPALGLDPATVEAFDRILGMTSAITSDIDADQVDISWHRELAVRLAALRALLNGGANG